MRLLHCVTQECTEQMWIALKYSYHGILFPFVMGMLTGILLGPVIFRNYGYMAVYLSSSIFCLFAIFHIFICVKETVTNENGVSLCYFSIILLIISKILYKLYFITAKS